MNDKQYGHIDAKEVQTAKYDPSVFDCVSINEARKIILTDEDEVTSEERWEKETPYLLKLMEPLDLSEKSLVLDFGTGIGRNAKALIEKYNCYVIGTDISANMRGMAAIYTPTKQFAIMDNIMIERLNIRFDAAIAIWALQHSYPLDAHVKFINNYLKEDGKLFVVNERVGFIPTDKGWFDDGTDVFMSLQTHFDTVRIDTLDPEVVSDKVMRRTFWGIFKKRANGLPNKV